MKDQYVGDIGDFGKVLLLKHLANCGFKIGVNWVLTENDDGKDGKHRDFIDYRGKDCLCSSDGDVLKQMALFARKPKEFRTIRDLEQLIRGFSDSAIFYPDVYPRGASQGLRKSLDDRAFSMLAPAEAVFFDPDNGLAVGDGYSIKHVYFADLIRYWQRGQSLLVYHHLGRIGSHEEQITETLAKLRRAISGVEPAKFHFRRGSARVYFLCIQPEHPSRAERQKEPIHIRPLTYTKSAWRKLAANCKELPPLPK
jgi:hypothetical protein